MRARHPQLAFVLASATLVLGSGSGGTHHWGMALAMLNEPANGAANPLPRATLLTAIAAEMASW